MLRILLFYGSKQYRNIAYTYIKVKKRNYEEPIYVLYVYYYVNHVIISVVKNYNLMNNSKLK